MTSTVDVTAEGVVPSGINVEAEVAAADPEATRSPEVDLKTLHSLEVDPETARYPGEAAEAGEPLPPCLFDTPRG